MIRNFYYDDAVLLKKKRKIPDEKVIGILKDAVEENLSRSFYERAGKIRDIFKLDNEIFFPVTSNYFTEHMQKGDIEKAILINKSFKLPEDVTLKPVTEVLEISLLELRSML